MAIQFSNTDAFGHTDATAYAMLSFNAFDKVSNSGRIVMSVYKDAAARAADITAVMLRKEFSVRDDAEAATTELTDLIAAIDTTGLSAVYAYVKTKDADLNGGTDV